MVIDVLGTTWRVVQASRHVRIDHPTVKAIARRLAAAECKRPVWRVPPHWWDDTPRTANYALVLDTLNFCFWGEPRWQVQCQGVTYDGYWALAAALRRGIEEGWPLLDAAALADTTEEAVARLLRGGSEIPLLRKRLANLREVGRVLFEQFEGSFANAIRSCSGSAQSLVELVVTRFPSFRDVATFSGQEVHFFKRAQILVADLVGAFEGGGLGRFDDLAWLTAFADYKLPQLLRADGVLVYSPELAAHVDSRVELAAGEGREVEIRAATVWAMEMLREELAALGREMPAFELDWLLWSAAQERQFSQPYHRARTLFY